MDGSRSRYGLLVSALGAGLLATAVFLPWYGAVHVSGAARAGAQPALLSAFDVVGGLSVALLVLAFLALTDALLPLVRHAGVPAGAGASLALLGGIAAACVAYRMFDLPAPAGAVAVSLRAGAWLALAGAVMIATGGFWPRVAMPPALVAQSRVESGWSGLSGWTPQP
jgi:hypothetical protein